MFEDARRRLSVLATAQAQLNQAEREHNAERALTLHTFIDRELRIAAENGELEELKKLIGEPAETRNRDLH